MKQIKKAVEIGILVLMAFEIKGADRKIIDTQYAAQGVITINYINVSQKKTKLVIEKGGNKYTYNVKLIDQAESFPLQMGNGDYTIKIYEHITDNRYKLIKKEVIKVAVEDQKLPFLNSVQNIDWDENSQAVKLAQKLVTYTEDETEKAKIIGKYLVEQLRYDYKKKKVIASDYLPDIDKALKEGKGICYDFSSLFAAMMRSQNVPTKLVMGYRKDIANYHSWNEFYDAKNDEWHIVDLTYDIYSKEKGKASNFIKDKADYIKEKEY